MSEYMERHAVARLIGAPPGYVGYDEGGQLTERVRRRPYSVILLDEIEKAHPDVNNVLLQVFDDGRLTDGKGRVVDFSNTIIIATSNLGASIIMDNLEKPEADRLAEKAIREELMGVLKGHFRPEFLNRIDEIIVFHALSRENIRAIVEIQLERVVRTAAAQNITLKMRRFGGRSSGRCRLSAGVRCARVEASDSPGTGNAAGQGDPQRQSEVGRYGRSELRQGGRRGEVHTRRSGAGQAETRGVEGEEEIGR